MADRKVCFQSTPNPNAGKFVVGAERVGPGGARSYFTPGQAADHPLAAAIMALEGVTSVFMVEDFVTVTKAPDAQWETVAPRVETVIDDHV